MHGWYDGSWREEHPHGDTLVWFPEPIGARDCRTVTGGTSLLVDAFASVRRVSLQLGEPPATPPSARSAAPPWVSNNPTPASTTRTSRSLPSMSDSLPATEIRGVERGRRCTAFGTEMIVMA